LILRFWKSYAYKEIELARNRMFMIFSVQGFKLGKGSWLAYCAEIQGALYHSISILQLTMGATPAPM
jgi:hypothetical protein